MEKANARMGESHMARYTLACNRPENDEHWHSSEPEWVGKASMSEFHRFVLIDDLDWRGFNALTMGLEGGLQLDLHLLVLREMKEIGEELMEAEGRQGAAGFFLHCFPFNSVQVRLTARAPLYLPCTFPVPSLYLPCTFPFNSVQVRLTARAPLLSSRPARAPLPSRTPHGRRCTCTCSTWGRRGPPSPSTRTRTSRFPW